MVTCSSLCVRVDRDTLHGRKSSDLVWVDDEWDKITEAAGLACWVCPERGFKEINPCLIHKYQRQPLALLYFLFYFILFRVRYSTWVAVTLIQTHLTIRKFSCLLITLSSDSPVMDVESIPESRRRCLSSLDLLRQNNFPSPKVQPWINKKKSAHVLRVLAFGRLVDEALFKYGASPWSLSSSCPPALLSTDTFDSAAICHLSCRFSPPCLSSPPAPRNNPARWPLC